MSSFAHSPGVLEKNVHGSSGIIVSSKGVVNGLSDIPNDGSHFGPDTMLGATSPNQTGAPYTQTGGIQEAVNYAYPKTLNIKIPAGKYVITAPWKSATIPNTGNIGTTLYYLIELPYVPWNTNTEPVFVSIEGDPNLHGVSNPVFPSGNEGEPSNVVIDISNIQQNTGNVAQYVFAIPMAPDGEASLTNIRMTGITFYNGVQASIGAVYAPKAMGGWFDQLAYYSPNGYTTNTYTSAFAISSYVGSNSLFGDISVAGAYSAFDLWHSHTTGFSLAVTNSYIGINLRYNTGHSSYISHYGVSGVTYPIYTQSNTGLVTAINSVNLSISYYGREIDSATDSYDVYLQTGISTGTIKIEQTRIYCAYTSNSLYPPLSGSQTGFLAYPLAYVAGQNQYAYQHYIYFGLLLGIMGYVAPSISANPPVSGTPYQNQLPYDIRLKIPITYNPTATAAATLATGTSISSSVTTSTKVSIPAGLTAADGEILTYEMIVPAGFYYEIVVTNATIGTAEVEQA